MKAEAKSLRFLGESPQKLSIPFFQRGYVWKESNWRELLDSLTDNESIPFLGSVIIKMTDSQNPTEAQVIDGQQRLTTLTLLSKAIYDTLIFDIDTLQGEKPEYDEDEDDVFGKSDLKSLLFYKVNAADPFKKSNVKIEHSRTDRESYEQIIKENFLILNNDIKYSNNIDLIDYESEETSPILRCYKFFRQELRKMKIEEIISLHNDMYNDNKKIIVLITMDLNDNNEQSIFDTINRAGVRLSVADIIKNDLFKKCIDYCDNDKEKIDEVIDLYEKKWAKLFYYQDDSSDWDETRVFGNQTRTNLEFLLYCVAFINWGKREDIFSDLANLYKKETDLMDYSQLVSLVNQINEYAEIFKKEILYLQKNYKDENSPLSFSFYDVKKRVLLVLEVLGVQMFYPYVLKLFKEENDSEILNRKLNILESFVVRRRLSSKGVSDYANKCDYLVKRGEDELLAEFTKVDSGITNRDVSQYLDTIKKNDNAKLLLFIIELYKRREDKQDINALSYSYTLEHIMPQKWQTNWLSVKLTDGYGKDIKDEEGNVVQVTTPEGQKIRDTAVGSLGNMTLLSHNLNASIRNSDFAKKINGEGDKKPGYRKYTSLFITQEIVSKYDNGTLNEWNEHSIYERTRELEEIFLKIWPNDFS